MAAYGGPYDYEWMNAVSQAGDLARELLPILRDFGLVSAPAPAPTPPPPTNAGIVVEPQNPNPFGQLPPWAWALIGGVGALVLLKLLD